MTPKRKWSQEEIFELIEVYEENSVLWDTKSKEHRNREKKDAILTSIGQRFKCSSEEIERKLHNLRNQVRKLFICTV